jgi:hypothetical protein
MSADYNGSESSGDWSTCNSNTDNTQATANTQAPSAIPTATGNQAPFTNGDNHNNSTIKPSSSPSLTLSTLPSAVSLFLRGAHANKSALSLFLRGAHGDQSALRSWLFGTGDGCGAGY